jgi:hypothetical protein
MSLSRRIDRFGSVTWPTLLAFGAALLVAAAHATAERREPILIQQTFLLSPPAMVGLGVSPELKLRLAIDPGGRVTEVETLSIQPATDYDAELSADVEEQLKMWRFAPAREDGVAVAASVELLVKVRETAGSFEDVVGAARNEIFFGSPEAKTAQLLRLPFPERQKLVDRYAGELEKHLVQDQKRTASSARFIVYSDAADPEVAQVLANNLEAAYNTFEEALGRNIEVQPERFKMVAFLFNRRQNFVSARAALRSTTNADGFYVAPGVLAFHQETAPEFLLSLMIHEAFHAFSDRRLRRPGRIGQPWFEEGMADYFGSSQIKKGRIVPGKTISRQFVMHYGQVFKQKTQAGLTLPGLKRAIKAHEVPDLKQLVGLSRQEFYGDDLELNYAVSWMLIHFLRHGEADFLDDQFPRLALYLYEGYGMTEACQLVYGLSMAELQSRFEDYVAAF